MSVEQILQMTCILCLANPCKVKRTITLKIEGLGTFEVAQCKACVKKYQRAERLSHVKDSQERQDWFAYFPTMQTNLASLVAARAHNP